MTNLVNPGTIEGIIGAKRHRHHHWGRLVTAEHKIYILHSTTCVNSTADLRECPYSVALDRLRVNDCWIDNADQPVLLGIHDGQLIPQFSLNEVGLREHCNVCGRVGHPTSGYGWQAQCLRGHAPCPVCGHLNTLRVDYTPRICKGGGARNRHR